MTLSILFILWVNQQGEEKRFTFEDLRLESDLALKILQDLGISKGERVLILLPRIPAWWFFIIALIKLGAVYSPAPTMLTVKDISYRMTTGGFGLIITDNENAPKVTRAQEESLLQVRCMVADGEQLGWISYPAERALLTLQSCPTHPGKDEGNGSPRDLLYIRNNRQPENGAP